MLFIRGSENYEVLQCNNYTGTPIRRTSWSPRQILTIQCSQTVFTRFTRVLCFCSIFAVIRGLMRAPNMLPESIEQLVSSLEKQELEVSGGRAEITITGTCMRHRINLGSIKLLIIHLSQVLWTPKGHGVIEHLSGFDRWIQPITLLFVVSSASTFPWVNCLLFTLWLIVFPFSSSYPESRRNRHRGGVFRAVCCVSLPKWAVSGEGQEKINPKLNKRSRSRSQARFLWKRIPQNLKNAELEQLYKVFESLWHNRFAQFYIQINYNWSPSIARIMIELKGEFPSAPKLLLILKLILALSPHRPLPTGDYQSHRHCLHVHLWANTLRDGQPESRDCGPAVHQFGLAAGGRQSPRDHPQEASDGHGCKDCVRGPDEEVDRVCVLLGELGHSTLMHLFPGSSNK